MTKNKAFTLIELMVVCSIIAILAACVFWIFGNAEQQNRDMQKIEKLQNIKTVLKAYLNDNGHYPSGTETNLKTLIPSDMKYQSIDKDGDVCRASCLSYHLGIPLERMDNEVLFTDEDMDAGFNGWSVDCESKNNTSDYCYDIKP